MDWSLDRDRFRHPDQRIISLAIAIAVPVLFYVFVVWDWMCVAAKAVAGTSLASGCYGMIPAMLKWGYVPTLLEAVYLLVSIVVISVVAYAVAVKAVMWHDEQENGQDADAD